jgi:hypothetical protein
MQHNTNEPVPMVVELFGHQKIAGYVSEHNVAGAPFIRVDVPETETTPAFSRMFHPNAIYCFNPCDTETMIAMVDRLEVRPIEPFEIRKLVTKISAQQLGAESEVNASDEGDDNLYPFREKTQIDQEGEGEW